MKDFITPEMVDKCIEITKDAQYDGDKYTFEVAGHAPCSLTSIIFPEIIDLALTVLKRQAKLKPLDIFVEIKTNPKHIRDKSLIPIPIFQDRKEQFSK